MKTTLAKAGRFGFELSSSLGEYKISERYQFSTNKNRILSVTPLSENTENSH